MKKTKIIIAGIGGVGGYFGGLLAKQYYADPNIDIFFVARGAHLQAIQSNGLKVIQGGNHFIARPTLATADPGKLGKADFIIVATKSFDLEAMIRQLQPCIHSETIILPLLNGVNNKERIQALLPENMVLEGCAYIVSRLKAAGVIENSGNIQKLYFGLDGLVNDRLLWFEQIVKAATIEVNLSNNISSIIWEKFIFISPTATATTYFDNCIGEILADEAKLSTLTALIEELTLLAKAKNIEVSADITLQTWNKLKALPFDATSSMHSDFQHKKADHELATLTGYVVNESQQYHIPAPVYCKIYAALTNKTIR